MGELQTTRVGDDLCHYSYISSLLQEVEITSNDRGFTNSIPV